ncbi:hypothetical protein CK203_071720 [Vitis vinifera]|uniref:DUF4283 domain-containing protein n=1 Tax=Vitis vinifera TaxID=29760 RepID=A0A438C3I3_VITVI|nr:hypothetical protein CK203_071720 [Vitis vinifera]
MVRRGRRARRREAEGRSAVSQVESKAFEIVVDDRKGKIQVLIVEKKGGVSSWVRLGSDNLGFFLEGLNLCIKDEKEARWGREWKEQGRMYSMTRGINRAGGFIRLGVSDLERKRKPGRKGCEEGCCGRSYATMAKRPLLGNPNVIARGQGEKMTLRSWGKFGQSSWDLKGSLGLAKLEKERALLEFEDLEEVRRVVSFGNRAMEGI